MKISRPRATLLLFLFGSAAFASLLGAFLWSKTLNGNELAEDELRGGHRLLIVFAHPDDEVTNSGLIRGLIVGGAEATILTLTNGNANPHSDLGACPEQSITDCRLRELADAAKILGIQHIVTPMLPDSKLDEVVPEASRLIAQELFKLRPDFVLTMEPSGLNKLKDHMAAAEATMQALETVMRDRPETFPTRIFLSTLPIPLNFLLRTAMPGKGGEPFPRRTIHLSADTVALKARVARAHVSQSATIRGLTAGLGPEKFFSWMDREAYYIVTKENFGTFLAARAAKEQAADRSSGSR